MEMGSPHKKGHFSDTRGDRRKKKEKIERERESKKKDKPDKKPTRICGRWRQSAAAGIANVIEAACAPKPSAGAKWTLALIDGPVAMRHRRPIAHSFPFSCVLLWWAPSLSFFFDFSHNTISFFDSFLILF
ncbi:hypothetical protein [Pandoravirus japonicus]|uniref:Uncharacterized protein n=1 Tax=Pandoravirus japonicus TaxID=2823154 RepID=A0A811BRQ0_9VIRU|nr:hypothetical protein [Pandoravirus japonicus]